MKREANQAAQRSSATPPSLTGSVRQKMNSRAASIVLCLLIAGCRPADIDCVDPSDPALTTRVGITKEDWVAIQQLFPERNGLVVKGVGRVSPDDIEVEFKALEDLANDRGGPIDRYRKKSGTWERDANFLGTWMTANGRK